MKPRWFDPPLELLYTEAPPAVRYRDEEDEEKLVDRGPVRVHRIDSCDVTELQNALARLTCPNRDSTQQVFPDVLEPTSPGDSRLDPEAAACAAVGRLPLRRTAVFPLRESNSANRPTAAGDEFLVE